MSHNSSKALAGQNAFVLGGTRGPGRSLAEAWGLAGAKIVITYSQNRQGAEDSMRKLKSQGCKGLLLRADLSDDFQAEMVAETVKRELGDLNLVCFNLTLRAESAQSDAWQQSLQNARTFLLPLASKAKILVLLPETSEGAWAENVSERAHEILGQAKSDLTYIPLKREGDGSWSEATLSALVGNL